MFRVESLNKMIFGNDKNQNNDNCKTKKLDNLEKLNSDNLNKHDKVVNDSLSQKNRDLEQIQIEDKTSPLKIKNSTDESEEKKIKNGKDENSVCESKVIEISKKKHTFPQEPSAYKKRRRSSCNYSRYNQDYAFKSQANYNSSNSSNSCYIHDSDKKNLKQIQIYERKLEELKDVKAIEELEIEDSKWDLKPKGFENIAIQQAKLSSLFIFPGIYGEIDQKKLDNFVKENYFFSESILEENSKLNPINSKNSRILILKNFCFETIDYNKLIDYIENFLKNLDYEQNEPTNFILSKWISNDGKHLVIEFKDYITCMITHTLKEKSFSYSDFKKDSNDNSKDNENFNLSIERPSDYIVQNNLFLKNGQNKNNDTLLNWNILKITLLSDSEYDDVTLKKELEKISPIKSFTLLKEKKLQKSLGIAFFVFSVDLEKYTTINEVIVYLELLIEMVKKLKFIKNCYFSHLTEKTVIQNCCIDFNSLKQLFDGVYVSPYPKLKVIQLINAVTYNDLSNDSMFNFIKHDIQREASKYGKIISLNIPRSSSIDFFKSDFYGLGIVYIEFDSEENACHAMLNLAGKYYNDRIVMCAYYSYEDYKIGLI